MTDLIELEGNKFRVSIEPDDYCAAPWDRDDGHGPVSEWKHHSFGMGTKPPKAPGEMILVWDRGAYRTYDFAEAVRIAKRDGWDAAPYDATETPGQKAHKAAMADFNCLRQWCDGQWSYVGVIVELLDDEGDATGETESLWGIESDAGEYLDETAKELAGEILHRLENQLKRA